MPAQPGQIRIEGACGCDALLRKAVARWYGSEKGAGRIHLRSRNDNDFKTRYPAIAKALQILPDETILEGEVVALDDEGHPSFSLLQNYGSSGGPIVFTSSMRRWLEAGTW